MRVLISGGGTGGHIYPALALLRHIKSVDSQAEFLYVGTEKGLESGIIPKENIPFETITIQGFKRSLSIENLKTVYLFLKSIRKAKDLIRDFKPDIVIGTGGYVSGAVVYAASRLKIPTIIHEQNSVPGMTNKFLAKYVSKIALAFPDAATYFPKDKVEVIGNPRGQEVLAIEKKTVLGEFSLDNTCPTVLLFGGSRGAKRINEAFFSAVSEFVEKPYQVLYVSGRIYYEELMEKVQKQGTPLTNISIQPYLSNMPEVLKNVDLVVGRAGATSLAEITALGLPSVLIPSPNVTNDHQTKNAESLVKAGAAIMVKDNELNGQSLISAIDHVMLDEATKHEMANQAKKLGKVDASDRMYQIMKDLQR